MSAKFDKESVEPAPMTEEEKKGVAAIVYLQGIAGITEPEDRALRGWRSMSKVERESTLKYYAMFSRMQQ